jgi:hypothetical protein
MPHQKGRMRHPVSSNIPSHQISRLIKYPVSSNIPSHQTFRLINYSLFSADAVKLPRGQERSSQTFHLKTRYTRGSVRVRQSLQVLLEERHLLKQMRFPFLDAPLTEAKTAAHIPAFLHAYLHCAISNIQNSAHLSC